MSLLLSGLFVGLSYLYLSTNTQLYIFSLGVISLAYVLPLLSKRLRDLEGTKIIFIAGVWAAVCMAGIFEELPLLIFALLFVQLFSFIFSLTIPFDVRDIHLDSKAQVSNLNEFISLPALSKLIVSLLITACLCTLALYLLEYFDLFLSIFLLAFYSVQGLLTFDLTKSHSEFYYLITLDGLILFKGLLFLLAWSI